MLKLPQADLLYLGLNFFKIFSTRDLVGKFVTKSKDKFFFLFLLSISQGFSRNINTRYY